MRPLKKSIDDAGGVPSVALACGKTPRAIYKWLVADALPRTEYTGETQYVKEPLPMADEDRLNEKHVNQMKVLLDEKYLGLLDYAAQIHGTKKSVLAREVLKSWLLDLVGNSIRDDRAA